MGAYKREAESASGSLGLGLVFFDSQWQVLSANADALAAIRRDGTDSGSEQTELRAFAAQVADRMRDGAVPHSFNYAGNTCVMLRFSCAYGKPGDTVNAALIGRAREKSSFALSLGKEFRLTPRETEALALCLKGYGPKEIAHRMGISVSTARSFLRLISIKVGATGRAEILSKVLDLMCEASLTCPFRVPHP